MDRKRRSTRCRSAAVAVLSAAALMLSQGTSFAATGNWGFGVAAQTVSPGSNVSWTPYVLCDPNPGPGTDPSPCSYSTTWRFKMGASNDGEFVNVGSSFSLVKRKVTGETDVKVGTCNVVSSDEVTCAASGSGSVNPGEGFQPASPILLRTASSSCTETAYATWFDTASEPQRPPNPGDNDDWQSLRTGGQCA
ncbi:hypothetical protein [Streptomyces albireticuli]|uniref:hypothetical protein n=1 Tax=Streptomyces albireticuli TaxID=1940 RepID=UPI0013318F22|nr:hypothetical protein [Streptomyces albireticuli]